jgi:hypothetical protein
MITLQRVMRYVHGGERSRGHNASAMAWFAAICYDDGFDIANYAVWRWGPPETEIYR